ncbi:ankyrin repeat domain-containing protein 46-like [Mizuhopecten yessoensis]|uniref:Ankyrin repeat domain-containing protein 46 n=1 Tax=Mizuhopecten yessoensis TaxID=6573 RepID=A0A210PG63_MIZYE|nr:ankyrin repeat domain-containing protein 46-like [Mizuhopecten yessoensis]OWF35441.1 Ankyrin repeat domain-containing protein 46 [Mizuhopecten yessoensis]
MAVNTFDDLIFEIMEAGDDLREAVNSCELEKVQVLLESGQHDVNARDGSGRTVLFIPVCRGHVSLVGSLVEHGADVRILDYNNNSALHWCGNTEVLEMLVAYGADIMQRNKLGLTPKEMALRRGLAPSIIEAFTQLEKRADKKDTSESSLSETRCSIFQEFSDGIGFRNLCLLVAGIFLLSLQFAYIITGASRQLEVMEPITFSSA